MGCRNEGFSHDAEVLQAKDLRSWLQRANRMDGEVGVRYYESTFAPQ